MVVMRVVSLLPLGVVLMALGVSECLGRTSRNMADRQLRAQMGVASAECDDGKVSEDLTRTRHRVCCIFFINISSGLNSNKKYVHFQKA